MSFLNPSILLGLFAVSVPILIHLLNLRKIRKVEFSTLMFLKEIQKSKMRRIKIKQLLLLMLRILAVAFLVLLFAKPVYEGFAGNKNNSSNSTVLIFIDDSFSMSARDNNGMYLNQAKESIKKILEAYKESDDIYLIPNSQSGFKERKILFDNFNEVLDSAGKIKIAYKPFSVTEVLNYSNQILKESKNPGKDVYIISDFQKNNFNFDILSDQGSTAKNSFNTYLIKTGNREIKNISLDSFNVVTKLLEKDKDIKVKIYLNNHSKFNAKNKTVNLYIDNELKGEKAFDIGPGDKKEVEFIFKTNKSGNLNGTLELVQSEFEDDEIIQDNKYYFSVHIPDKFNIGLIEDNPTDSYFLNLAVSTAADILSDSINRKSDLFNITLAKTINDKIFSNDVVFILNKASFTDEESNILMNYVSNGGGVFIFPGNSTDINNYNKTILNKLGTAVISKLNNDVEQNKNLKLDKVDFEHPVLSDVFLNQKLNITSDKFNIDSPEIKAYYELLPGERSNAIITLSNNKPFLIESGFSKGKIILSSVSAKDDFSNLPLKSIFVPLIIRSIYYLSNNFEYQKEYITGNSNLILVKGLKNISGINLPDKSNIRLNVEFNSSKDNFLFLPYSEITSEPGNYIIDDSSGAKYYFSMNRESKESNMDTMSRDELAEYFEKNNIKKVKIIDPGENITEIVNESRTGFSLWKYFLMGAILFVISELLLSKKIEDG